MLSDDQTREYLKLQPATVPSDIEYYQNILNTRQYTLANLIRYVKLSSGINTTGWIYSLVTNKTYSNNFYFQKEQSLVDKTLLQCEYLLDVWVKKWSLVCDSNHYSWYCEFHWQASHDKKTWITIGEKMQTEKVIITGTHDERNAIEWVFTNPENPASAAGGEERKKYRYWRVHVTKGTSSSGWVNMMFMKVL